MPSKPVPRGVVPLRERRTVAEEWAEWERAVMPAEAGPVQRREMKRAFYAGAYNMLALMCNGLDEDSEPTELDLKWMDAVHAELELFRQAVARDDDR